MDSGELKTRCLGLPGASEEFPFGDEVSVFKVGGKMFALCSLDAGPPLRLSVKCDPELAAQLRSAYPAIRPGHTNPPGRAVKAIRLVSRSEISRSTFLTIS